MNKFFIILGIWGLGFGIINTIIYIIRSFYPRIQFDSNSPEYLEPKPEKIIKTIKRTGHPITDIFK